MWGVTQGCGCVALPNPIPLSTDGVMGDVRKRLQDLLGFYPFFEHPSLSMQELSLLSPVGWGLEPTGLVGPWEQWEVILPSPEVAPWRELWVQPEGRQRCLSWCSGRTRLAESKPLWPRLEMSVQRGWCSVESGGGERQAREGGGRQRREPGKERQSVLGF